MNVSLPTQPCCLGVKVGIYFFPTPWIHLHIQPTQTPWGTGKRCLLDQKWVQLTCPLVKPHISQMGKLRTGPEFLLLPPHPASSLSQLEAILHTAAGVIFLKPFLSCHFSACCFLLPFVKSRFLLLGSQSFLQNAPFLRVSIMGLYGTFAPKCCSDSLWLSHCCLPPGLCTCQTTHLENVSACSLCPFSFLMCACSAFLTAKPLSPWN